MSDRAAFLAVIAADPDDDTPRVVFADWLEERGESRRAAVIRVQCALARTPADDPGRAALAAREDDLFRSVGETAGFWPWLWPPARLRWPPGDPGTAYRGGGAVSVIQTFGWGPGAAAGKFREACRVHLARGFPDRLTRVAPADFVAHADALLAELPTVRRVRPAGLPAVAPHPDGGFVLVGDPRPRPVSVPGDPLLPDLVAAVLAARWPRVTFDPPGPDDTGEA